ncbi:MAG: GWxTD domain-containing protein [Calditrichaeota bacterium]|nr:GWxTD domain-containing protein [Calditrichota bacterium]
MKKNNFLKWLFVFNLILGISFPVFFRDGFCQNSDQKPDSIAILQAQILQSPGQPELAFRLAELYLREEMLDQAEKLFRSLSEIDSFKVRALTGLGRSHFQRTPSKIIPLERLKELLKIDHRSKALKKFREALKINPDYLPAHYWMGRTYLLKDDVENLQRAKKEFLWIFEKKAAYRDLIYQIAYNYQKLKDFDNALKYFQKITEHDSDFGRSRIRMAEVYFEIGEYRKCSDNYFLGMEKLTDHDMLDYLFDEQKILLTKEEKKEFESAPYAEKKRVFIKFWKSRDPDPSTPENERLIEHFRRVKFARENFHFTAPPYYDDRGRIYIKYGKPDVRYNSPIGNLPVKDNESWSYESIQDGLVFDFVADGGYYRLAQDLTEAAMSGYGYNQRLILANELYQDRSHISKTYSRLATGFSQQRLNDYHISRNEALDKYPGELFRPANEKKFRFPFITRWSQFKGEGGLTRVEFYTSFPGMALKLNPFDDKPEKNVDFYIELDDTDFRTILDEHKRLRYKIRNPQKLRDHQFVFQDNYSLKPEIYQAAFVLTDVETATKGVKRRQLRVRNFSGDSLMVSSLQLSAEIKPKTKNSNKTFVKNDLEVDPYTFKRVMRKTPIYLYFEIYNLKKDEDGNTHYKVVYKIETIKPERSFWQKTFGAVGRIFGGTKKSSITLSGEHMGDSKDAVEFIAFDLKNLERGEQILRVTVTDLISGESKSDQLDMILIE